MTSLILIGCNGKMGQVITDLVNKKDNFKIVAGVDVNKDVKADYDVFDDITKITSIADVVIDFSHPASLQSTLDFCREKKIPLVLCTTGFSSEQVLTIKEASKVIPIFFSANMSLGINLLVNLSKMAVKALGEDFDIEIIEKHHNQKIDSPSGTAIMIADSISSQMEREPQYVYDRHSYRKKRGKDEIGIHSVRAGTIAGQHEIIFAGQDEMISISHTAFSKKIFGAGALNAAEFVKTKEPGLYDMSFLTSK